MRAIQLAVELPQRAQRHLVAFPVGVGLNVAAEVLLQRPGQHQTVILLQHPGRAAFPGLAVDADHRLIATTDIVRINGKIGHLPAR